MIDYLFESVRKLKFYPENIREARDLFEAI